MTPVAFGQYLRRQRERVGVTLDTVARRTNVISSIFAGLEQGDCSRFPPGVYGRGFLRGYARAIGLDPDEVVAEAEEHFPQFREGGRGVPGGRRHREELRLRLDVANPVPSRPMRALLALGLGIGLAAGAGASGWFLGASFWAPVAVVLGLCYASALALMARPAKSVVKRPQVGLGLQDAEFQSDGLNVLPVPDALEAEASRSLHAIV